MAEPWTTTWNNKPQKTDNPALQYLELNKTKATIGEVVGNEHSTYKSILNNTSHGLHKRGSAKAYIGSTFPTLRPDGATALAYYESGGVEDTGVSDKGRIFFKVRDDSPIVEIYVFRGADGSSDDDYADSDGWCLVAETTREELSDGKTYDELVGNLVCIMNSSTTENVSIVAGASIAGISAYFVNLGTGALLVEIASGVNISVPVGAFVQLLWNGSEWVGPKSVLTLTADLTMAALGSDLTLIVDAGCKSLDISAGAVIPGTCLLIVGKSNVDCTVTTKTATTFTLNGQTVNIIWNGDDWQLLQSSNGFLQALTSGSGSWKVPFTGKYRITCIGGGGHGASSNDLKRVAGGGAGAYVEANLTLQAGSSIPYSVGTGGVAPSTAATATSFGNLNAGAGGSVASNVNTGGAGGTPTGGDINISGSPGHPAATSNPSGNGGSGPLGQGGHLDYLTTSNGASGTGFGAGGSGAYSIGGSTYYTGGSGTSGIILIRW